MKAVRIIFKRDLVEALVSIIGDLVESNMPDDDDRLVLAALAELRKRMQQRLLSIQTQYTISLTPCQAIALRIMYTDFPKNYTVYVGTALLLISNQVEQSYSTPLKLTS